MKAVLFDFDGTIADTRGSIIECVSFVADHYNLRQLPRQVVVSMIGLPLEATLRKLGIPEQELAASVSVYRSRYSAVAADLVKPFSGAEGVLETLSQMGLRTAIVSSKGRAAIQTLLETWGLSSRFELVVSADDVSQVKPDPESVFKVCKALGLEPSDCVVVGDTRIDLQLARASGAIGCLAAYGYGDTAECSGLADFVIERLDDLPRTLSNT
jgi:phosphoglycolate phosphatase